MTHVLYHSPCADGFAAAFAARLALGTDGVRYLPVNYDQPLPEGIGPEDDVYVLDFCYPLEVMFDLSSRCGELIIIDHHSPQLPVLEVMRGRPSVTVKYAADKSGCVLTWEHFHGDSVGMPDFFTHLQARDLGLAWTAPERCHPDVHGIYAGLWLSVPRSFDHWLTVSMMPPDLAINYLIERGRMVQDVRGIEMMQILESTHLCDLGGHLVPAVNSPVHQSELGHALLALHLDAPFVLVWFLLPDAQRVKLSLRGRQGVSPHLGEMLRAMFGPKAGGHHLAAGADISLASLVPLLGPLAKTED